MRSLVTTLCLIPILIFAACATSKKQRKARSGLSRVKVGMTEADAVKNAGTPTGIEGSGGVERFWYEVRSIPMPPGCAAVDVKAGVVAGVYPESPCPPALYAHDMGKQRAMKKGVRLGMSREDVEKRLGKPALVTADEGREYMYFPKPQGVIVQPGSMPYGRVDVGAAGKVIGFTDVRPEPGSVDEELPLSAEKGLAVRRLRAGMDEATVVEKMGKPNERLEQNGLVILRYQKKTFGQPIITEQIELKDGRVFALRQFDHKLAHWFGASKEERAARAARKKAVAAAATVILLEAVKQDAANKRSSGGDSSSGGSSTGSVPTKRTHTKSCSQVCADYKDVAQYTTCVQRCRAQGGK